MGRGTPAERTEYVEKVKPIALEEVLLLPYYSAYSRKVGAYERVVARPFLYCPRTPVVVPSYHSGYSLHGVVAVCPRYFATGIRFGFYGTEKIDGKECQLQAIMKARDAKEAERILLDFKYLVSQKEITLGTTRNPLTIGADEQHVYALTTNFTTPCDSTYINRGGSVVNFTLWNYEHRTKLSVDLTAEEIRTVNGFFDKYLKQLQR